MSKTGIGLRTLLLRGDKEAAAACLQRVGRKMSFTLARDIASLSDYDDHTMARALSVMSWTGADRSAPFVFLSTEYPETAGRIDDISPLLEPYADFVSMMAANMASALLAFVSGLLHKKVYDGNTEDKLPHPVSLKSNEGDEGETLLTLMPDTDNAGEIHVQLRAGNLSELQHVRLLMERPQPWMSYTIDNESDEDFELFTTIWNQETLEIFKLAMEDIVWSYAPFAALVFSALDAGSYDDDDRVNAKFFLNREAAVALSTDGFLSVDNTHLTMPNAEQEEHDDGFFY